jgi:hypothetical protein
MRDAGSATSPPDHPSRLRRCLALAMLFVAVAATAATQPNFTTLDGTTPQARMSLDKEHPLVSQRFVVSVPAYTAAGRPFAGASIVIDVVTAFGPTNQPVPQSQALQLRITPVDAGAGSGVTPVPGAPRETSVDEPIDLSAGPNGGGGVSLNCALSGPCERAFRLIGTLMTSVADRAEIRWHLKTHLSYTGGPYPSAAALAVRVDEPVSPPGPPPQLDVSTPLEEIRLSAQHPVALRLIQVRLAASELTGGAAPRTLLEGFAVTGPAERTSHNAMVTMRRVPDTVTGLDKLRDITAASVPTTGQAEDPFLACVPDADCVRTYVVSASWTYGPEARYLFQTTLHRLDLLRAYAAVPDAIQVRVLDGLEPVAPLTKVHFEGRMPILEPSPGATPTVRPTQTIWMSTRVAGVEENGRLGRLLLVPGSATLKVGVVGPAGLTRAAEMQLRTVNDYSGSGWLRASSGDDTIARNPLLTCTIGSRCEWQIFVSESGDFEPREVKWTVDFEVYSYPGLPLVVEHSGTP